MRIAFVPPVERIISFWYFDVTKLYLYMSMKLGAYVLQTLNSDDIIFLQPFLPPDASTRNQ